jgi:acylphosphatase
MSDLSMTIFGRVQGVYFRKSTQEQAKERHITGWVRNRKDGTVEVLAQGQEETLLSFLKWCKKGPRFAKVERIEINWIEHEDTFSGFEVFSTI